MEKTKTFILIFTLFFVGGFFVFAQDNESKIRIGVYQNPPKIFIKEDGSMRGLL